MKRMAFTLVEMLMALLIISVILSASLPVISGRMKADVANANSFSGVPVGMIALWKKDGAMPDNTWLEANGQAIPNGIEYEEIRRIYGTNLPDLRGADETFYEALDKYLSADIKNYLQTNISALLPSNMVSIWKSDAVPSFWAWDRDFDGYFIRGLGGNSATLMTVQTDAIRNIYGHASIETLYLGGNQNNSPFTINWGGDAGWDHSYSGSSVGWQSNLTFDASKVVPVANENRPINKAVKFIKFSGVTLPAMPQTPVRAINFRYIVKVRN